MRKFWNAVYFLLFIFCAASLNIQAQTDVAASVYGAFNSSTSNTDGLITTTQNQSNAAGGLLELRHIRNPFVGFEATYSYNRANQNYVAAINGGCPSAGSLTCGDEAEVPANAHEITGDWVASLKFANLRPFALLGGGILLTVPSTGMINITNCSPHASQHCSTSPQSFPTQRQTTGVYVYGAGLDWTIFPHLGLRFQYRGNLYKAPDLASAFTSTNSFTHNSEPMIGAFFQF